MRGNVVWCGSKNGYQKNMGFKESGLHAQMVITIISSSQCNLGGGGGADTYITI